jgi:integrase
MKIKPILGNDYKSKDGTYPIYIRVNIGKKRRLVPVGVKIKKEEWDAKSGRVKIDKRPNGAAVNLKILELCNSIEKNNLQGGGVELGNKEDFYWWFEERLNYSKQKHSLYNWKKLNAVYNKLKVFAPELSIKRLDYKFLLDFEKHMLGLGNDMNTVADNLMRIKIIVNSIIRSGAMEYHKNPFLSFKMTTQRTKKERIEIGDIEKLEAESFVKHPSIQLARDMYIFSFYCAGIRFGDLCRIKMEMIQGGRLRYKMHKTKIERNIKLMPQAIAVIDKYKNSKEYLFDTKVDWKNEDQSINARNSFYNTKLKDGCDLIGIKKITFHTSRNSFADYAKKKGIDVHTLKDLFGHTKVSTTEQYMKSFYEEETDSAMDTLFG